MCFDAILSALPITAVLEKYAVTFILVKYIVYNVACKHKKKTFDLNYVFVIFNLRLFIAR